MFLLHHWIYWMSFVCLDCSLFAAKKCPEDVLQSLFSIRIDVVKEFIRELSFDPRAMPITFVTGRWSASARTAKCPRSRLIQKKHTPQLAPQSPMITSCFRFVWTATGWGANRRKIRPQAVQHILEGYKKGINLGKSQQPFHHQKVTVPATSLRNWPQTSAWQIWPWPNNRRFQRPFGLLWGPGRGGRLWADESGRVHQVGPILDAGWRLQDQRSRGQRPTKTTSWSYYQVWYAMICYDHVLFDHIVRYALSRHIKL